MQNITLNQKLRYRFDELMARGPSAQIAMLGLLSLALIVLTACIVLFAGLATVEEGAEPPGFGALVWQSLMHTMDAGTLGGDAGTWAFRFVMLFITLGGIFVLSALIGILNGAIEGLLETLRKGKSFVVETRHTIILGFTPKVLTLLTELAEANGNVRGASVVVLADRDKVEMDDEIDKHMGGRRLKVVTRSGSPLTLEDLAITNLDDAKTIIVVAPEGDGEPMDPALADTIVLKTLLAVAKLRQGKLRGAHVVAELQDERTLQVARLVVREEAALIVTPPLVSRLLVQTGRQSGLSAVYTELLDFGGCEIYIKAEGKLAGRTFREGLAGYEDSILMGVLTADGQLHLPPSLDRLFVAGDKVIAISLDDDTVVLNARGRGAEAALIAPAPAYLGPKVERTLVLGASQRLDRVLHELDAYVAEGSETLIVGEDERAAERLSAKTTYGHMRVVCQTGDITDRAVLDALPIAGVDHVLVLSETEGRTQELADARTLITLLHLRDIARKAGLKVAVTTEMLDIRNQVLASVAEPDDFIVSNRLVSLLMAQVAENPHLVRIFEGLFSPEGHEIYLKPATNYILAGQEADFYTVTEAAARQGQVALGYRLAGTAKDAETGYGVVVNPKKSARVRFGADDRVIVLAES